MAIDWSFLDSIPGAIRKSRVKALDKADKKKAIESQDKQENAKAKARAKGRCEVIVQTMVCAASHGVPGHEGRSVVSFTRCPKRDTQTHHLIYGIGRKNKGDSILATYKIRTCDQCHTDIGAKVLKPTTEKHDAATVRYWRSK